ncbi:MAG: pilin [Candidatus Paceibacterota bacterium]
MIDFITNLIFPNIAHAAECSTPPCNLTDLVFIVFDLIELAVPLIFALAILFFLWGVFNFIFINQNNPEKREEGKKFMIWGIMSIFVMVSLWGIVNLLSNTFFGATPDGLRDNVLETRPDDNFRDRAIDCGVGSDIFGDECD